MATLYVENIPDELYEALRGQARQRGKSIAAEVLSLLEENVPTAKELKERERFFRRAQRMRSRGTPAAGPFPSTADMQREDRQR